MLIHELRAERDDGLADDAALPCECPVIGTGVQIALMHPAEVAILTADAEPVAITCEQLDAHTEHELRDLRRRETWFCIDGRNGGADEGVAGAIDMYSGKANYFISSREPARGQAIEQRIDRFGMRGFA